MPASETAHDVTAWRRERLEVPGMAAHLVGCPACREDHESLRALVGGD